MVCHYVLHMHNNNFYIVCRIIVQQMQRYSKEVTMVQWNIASKYKEEMRTVSKVVRICFKCFIYWFTYLYLYTGASGNPVLQ